jgi:hypothetical protein
VVWHRLLVRRDDPVAADATVASAVEEVIVGDAEPARTDLGGSAISLADHNM